MIYLASLEEETKDKIAGYKIIHTKRELDAIIINTKEFNKVIIRPDFAHEFFTPTGLIEYIANVKSFNYNVNLVLDFKNNDESRSTMITKISECRNVYELNMLQNAHEKEFMDTLRYLINRDTDEYNQMLLYSSQVSRLQSVIEGLKAELDKKDKVIDMEAENKLAYQSKFHALVSRINYQYNITVDKNKLFNVDSNMYDKVLYIKEITRVQYVDSLVYYLKEICRIMLSMPTRILVIEGYYANSKIPLYPNLVPHHELTERDVISGDILMLGMQPNIMQDILKNSSNISLLIILDRAGYSVPHLSGENVEVLYTVSDLKDLPEGIPLGRAISYSDKTQYIKYIKDFDSIDASAKISEYSSMPIVKNIMNMLIKK